MTVYCLLSSHSVHLLKLGETGYYEKSSLRTIYSRILRILSFQVCETEDQILEYAHQAECAGMGAGLGKRLGGQPAD